MLNKTEYIIHKIRPDTKWRGVVGLYRSHEHTHPNNSRIDIHLLIMNLKNTAPPSRPGFELMTFETHSHSSEWQGR